MGKERKFKKYNGLIASVFLLVIACGIFLNLPEDKKNFSFSDNLGLWQASAGTIIQLKAGSVQLTKGPRDIYVVIPQINLSADLYDVCILEMELPIAYDQGSFIFLSPYNIKTEKETLDFDTGTANHLNHLYINFSKHDDWHGNIRDIILYPSTNSEIVSLKSITFVRANLATKIRAWWNDFTRYSDPTLGAVFGWPSAFFIKNWFNPLVMPFFWVLLTVTLLCLASVSILRLDIRISKITIGIFFLILSIAWGFLDLGNNIYCIKAIKRNASLYWGKSSVEKRGIVTGNPEFIRFMKFCDESIPVDGRILNYVARDNTGSPDDALGGTQFNFNLRTRVESLRMRANGEIPKTYYVFYRFQQKEIKGIDGEQNVMNYHFALQAKDKLLQQVSLQHDLEDISDVSFKINNEEIDPKDISVIVLADDKKTIIGSSEFLGVQNGEMIVRVIPLTPYRRSSVFLVIENRGEKPIHIGGSRSDTYRDGKCYFRGEEIKGDLAFRLYYEVKNLVLFKKYNDYAYILTK